MLASALTSAIGSAVLVVVVVFPIVWLWLGPGEFLKRLTIFQHGWGLALVGDAFAVASFGSKPNYPDATVLAITGAALILSAIATNQYRR